MKQPLSNYTNHSGGAKGADMAWDTIGREYGFNNHIHYRPEDYDKAPGIIRDSIDLSVKLAALDLGRPDNFNGIKLVKRNWFQVDNSDAIFAISYIIPVGGRDSRGFKNTTWKEIVAGGTGWAVEMAIHDGRDVYVFDMNKEEWFTWRKKIFVETNTPVLTLDYAGIGSREITPGGMKAIRDVYVKTLNNIN